GELILDGEVVGWSTDSPQSEDRNGTGTGRAMPFSQLQKRLGRKTVTDAMKRSVPVAYVVFDVLYADGDLVIDRPLQDRAAVLDGIFARARRPATVRTPDAQGKLVFEPAVETQDGIPAAVIRAPALRADSPQHLNELFDMAQARGNEGLMIKDLQS